MQSISTASAEVNSFSDFNESILPKLNASIKDSCIGQFFNSSSNNGQGVNIVSNDKFNIDGNIDISGKKNYFGIVNYYSDKAGYQYVNSNITIDTPYDDFIFKPTIDNNYSESVTGISISAIPLYSRNSQTLNNITTDFTLNANNIIIDLKSDKGNVIGLSSQGHGASSDISSIKLNASGKIFISSISNAKDNTYAIENNTTGKISLIGSEVKLFAENKSQSWGYLNFVNTVNQFKGTTEFIATDALGTGVNLEASGSEMFISTIDLQSHAITDGQVFNTDTDSWDHIHYTTADPETVKIQSAADISLFAHAENSDISSPVFGVIARHYSWTNGDLDEQTVARLDFTSNKNINIEAQGGNNSLKVAAISLDTDNVDGYGNKLESTISGKNVQISASANNATVSLSDYVDLWGDANVVGIGLINGNININANENVSITAMASGETFNIRGLDSSSEVLGAIANSGGYITENGKKYTAISKGSSASTIKSNGNIAIISQAQKASQAQGILWRSEALNQIESGNSISLQANVDEFNNKTSENLNTVAGLEIQDGKTEISAKNSLFISGSQSSTTTEEKGRAFGIKIAQHSNSKINNLVANASDITVQATAKADDIKTIALFAEKESLTELQATDSLTLSADTFAALALSSASVKINADNSKKSQIKADLLALTSGKLDFTLGQNAIINSNLYAGDSGVLDLTLNDASVFTGYADNFSEQDGIDTHFEKLAKNSDITGIKTLTDKGAISLTLNKAQWNVTQNSWIDNFNIDNATIVLSSPNLQYQGYRFIKTDTISGNNSQFNMAMDLEKDSIFNVANDQVWANTSTQNGAKHLVNLLLSGGQVTKAHSDNWLFYLKGGLQSSNLSVDLKDGQVFANGSQTPYVLRYVSDDSFADTEWQSLALDKTAIKSEGNKAGGWYLVQGKLQPEDPNPPEIEQQINIGISASQALAFASELEDLRTRLGEVRYGAQDGIWVRLTHEKDHANGVNGSSFEQNTESIHVGFDNLIYQSEESAWLLGMALRYGKTEQEGFDNIVNSEGNLYQYSGKLYATWMKDNGLYTDFVMQAGRYHQELSGYANDKFTKWDADYHTWGYGASIELGQMISFYGDEKVDDRPWFNHWFVEPQAQLSYFMSKGADYKTTTGMHVVQDNADFLTGRLGIVIGKKWNKANIDSLDKEYIQLAFTGGIKQEFLGSQKIQFQGIDGVKRKYDATDFSGTSIYYGIMADCQINDNMRFYAQARREESSELTREYVLNAGLKYQF